jgi:aromatic ring hydroxylase
MGARRGQEYLEGLRDGREVWLGAKRVDVAEHPAFAGTRAGLAGYFDWQYRYADECLMADPETGERIGVSHLIPKGAEDLRRRAVALERLARYSAGYLGRTPDYVNVTTAGFAGRLDVFGKNGNTRAVTALTRFQREIALKDLALTHTIVHPVVDKSVDDISGVNGELALKIVDKSSRGITVRGARLLATLGPFADELFVYPGQPLPKNADPGWSRFVATTTEPAARPSIARSRAASTSKTRSSCSTTWSCRGTACSSTATSTSTTRSWAAAGPAT